MQLCVAFKKTLFIVSITIWLSACGGGGGSSSESTDSEPTVYAIGDTGPAGGVVFLITDGGLHGLEAAPVDQSSGPWGCEGIGESITGADGTAIGTGEQNIRDILACTDTPIAADIAAGYALNGYNDWFLPSRDELNEPYLNNMIVGGFSSLSYWSSSESIALQSAIRQRIDDGRQFDDFKGLTFGVRAVRAF